VADSQGMQRRMATILTAKPLISQVLEAMGQQMRPTFESISKALGLGQVGAQIGAVCSKVLGG
jgi:hypothetical protein